MLAGYFVEPEQAITTRGLELSGPCDLKQNCILKSEAFKIQLSYSGLFKPAQVIKIKLSASNALDGVLLAISDQQQNHPPNHLQATASFIEWEGFYTIPTNLDLERPLLQLVVTQQGIQYYAEVQPQF